MGTNDTLVRGCDHEWDAFLESHPRGHFQQSSRWGRVKALDGWLATRVYCDTSFTAAGGLQLLWKQTRFGRIGYVSKGPVLASEEPQSVAAIIDGLAVASKNLQLQALILQPPDDSAITESMLVPHGYSRSPVAAVVRATGIIDLKNGYEALKARMGRQTRREARQATNRGVAVRLGGRSDLRRFYELMVDSCRRQGTQPNPSRLELLEELWDAFEPRVLLGLASLGGEDVAGLLMIGHGTRLTFWKKGWNSQQSRSYANVLLNVEALGWACDRGYEFVDFAAMDPKIAETLVSRGALSDAQRRSRDMFNLRLGAAPIILPPARLLVINPFLRRLFESFRRWRILEQSLMRRFGS